jgi:predicted RecB family nuclease
MMIGTDFLPADPRIAWVRLDQPAVRVVDHDVAAGWRWRSLLEDADAELRHRVAIADAVSATAVGAERVAAPVVIDECKTCPWWPACRAELDPDDLSLRIARGRLDRLEVTALRDLGVTTVADLSVTDVETLLPAYLPEVAHRPDAETRLRAIARRARMLERGEPIVRETSGPIGVPTAAVEIDLDIETSALGRIYLWGFEVTVDGASRYIEFSRFADLAESDEAALAREALGWLRHQIDGPRSARVFHYSGYEVAMIEALAARCPGDELLDWATTYAANDFVDLLEIVQGHFFGAAGLGLKQIAVAAGFGWRDPDPGGLNSQRWFDEAVHAADPETRAAARRRVLAYNEDDVRATAHLRAWLRTL